MYRLWAMPNLENPWTRSLWCALKEASRGPWKWKKGESESRSVVSDSLPPHGLHSPWNSPGQNTGVVAFSPGVLIQLHIQGFWFSLLSGWSLSICISHKFPDASGAGLRPHFENCCMESTYVLWLLGGISQGTPGEENQTFKHIFHMCVCIYI